jgi:GDP-L-fucose synthase
MVGRAISRTLTSKGYSVITREGDLRTQFDVVKVFDQKYDYVFICAAKVGGIVANRDNPVSFLYDNTLIAMNVLAAAHRAGIQNLMFLGSSCIYPKLAPQPIKE